ncbi:ABC-2 transporter permease [Thermosyntropha sp.]|uniref:ABC-2 transporter permease n=1 Tax=Thermosyntropha sp. TaxID=2740820 RepID=UPI0025D2FB33|nr:ABC-2 transporter permease [Thermosyntropha sp.]MBO8158167.1 ABC-2 transporter permease [Thermosyntropha sp.]
MYNLILKDFLLQKKTFLFAFLYVAVMVIAFRDYGDVASIIVLSYAMLLTACAYDDKSKADMVLNSLPLKRDTIVWARYLSVYVFALSMMVFYALLYWVISILPLPVHLAKLSGVKAIAALLIIGFLGSIYFPFYFKLGYMKSRLVNFIVFFLIFGGVMPVLSNFAGSGLPGGMSGLMEVRAEIIAGLFILLFLCVQVVSVLLSLRFYRARDF